MYFVGLSQELIEQNESNGWWHSAVDVAANSLGAVMRAAGDMPHLKQIVLLTIAGNDKRTNDSTHFHLLLPVPPVHHASLAKPRWESSFAQGFRNAQSQRTQRRRIIATACMLGRWSRDHSRATVHSASRMPSLMLCSQEHTRYTRSLIGNGTVEDKNCKSKRRARAASLGQRSTVRMIAAI